MLEIHSAHGYLLHEFLSPLTNQRNDAYGGDRAGRMRFPLEVAETVRAAWPKEKPLFVRISSVDGLDGGWSSTIPSPIARESKARGVDVIDCSSGGLIGSATAARIPRGLGFQVPFAEKIRKDSRIKTMTVGLIVDPHQAENGVGEWPGRSCRHRPRGLVDPNWPLHARYALGEFYRRGLRRLAAAIWLVAHAAGAGPPRRARGGSKKSVRRLRFLFCVVTAISLVFSGLRAVADGGPDHWAVTGIASDGVLDVFAEPSTDAPKLGAIPSDGRKLDHLGCINEPTYQEWLAMSEDERRQAAERGAGAASVIAALPAGCVENF